MSDALTKICADKANHVAASKAARSLSYVKLTQRASAPRGFFNALKTAAMMAATV